jgi:zinc transport system substrate-binding protein
MPRSTLVTSGALVAGALLLTACSADPGASPADGDDRTRVLASFYPLQYVAEQVGGDLVQVSSLTPPGAEPHDVELSPRQVRSVSETDLVVYLSGFQNAVDEAIDARAPERVVDAADVVDLIEGGAHAHAEGEDDADEHADEHAEDEHADDDHAVDPHFWLDPQRLAALAQPVADALAEADPANADAFSAAADRLTAELADVDAAYTAGLASCERRVVVASHEAYGYLADTYDLEQVGISGLDPEAEPSPARLRDIGDVVRSRGVTTLYTETLVNPKVAETLAGDLGVTTAVLDPIESQSDPAADYRAVMDQNLEALRAGLGCS